VRWKAVSFALSSGAQKQRQPHQRRSRWLLLPLLLRLMSRILGLGRHHSMV
jgi:hypothetical protein